ncbi:hypothetical protein BH10BAC6_BH10BAC6_08950 [soil metagenome]
MLDRNLTAVLIAALTVLCVSFVPLRAQVVEGEVFIGGEVSHEKNDSTSTSRGSFTLGGGVSWPLIGSDAVDLNVHTFPMFCFGTNKAGSFDITQFHLPLGVLLRFGEYGGEPRGMTIGGGVGAGVAYTAGMLATKNTDLRPYLEVEIMLRFFKRGLFKLRYSTIFGTYTDALGSAISYHSLCVIGSTSW